MRKRTHISAAEATPDQLCSIGRDNLTIGDFWILTDGEFVTITKQKAGTNAAAMTTVPRNVFAKMIRWYQRPQKIKQ